MNDWILVSRSELLQMLGKYALPPWKDSKGNVLGGDIDCAPLAQELSDAVDDLEKPSQDTFGVCSVCLHAPPSPDQKVRVLRVMEYVYDNVEAMEQDMARWVQANPMVNGKTRMRGGWIGLEAVLPE